MDSMIYVAGHNLREKRLRAEYLGACEILIYYCIQCMFVYFRICHVLCKHRTIELVITEPHSLRLFGDAS